MNKKNLALALLLTLGLGYGSIATAGCSSCGGCRINEVQPEKERKSACGSGNCGLSASCVKEENNCKSSCGFSFCGDKSEKVKKNKNSGKKSTGKKKSAVAQPTPAPDAA